MIGIQCGLIITGEPAHTASKQWHWVPKLHQLLSEKEDAAMFKPLYSNTNQQLLKNFCNQSSPYENYTWFPLQMCIPQNQHFSRWAKINGTQRRALVSPWRMHCVYSGMAKGTSWVEATSNSKKIKPVALAIVELCKSEGISQSGRQLIN